MEIDKRKLNSQSHVSKVGSMGWPSVIVNEILLENGHAHFHVLSMVTTAG